MSVKCKACGTELENGERQCSRCGKWVEESQTVDTAKLRRMREGISEPKTENSDAEAVAFKVDSVVEVLPRDDSCNVGLSPTERARRKKYKIFGAIAAAIVLVVVMAGLMSGPNEEKYRTEAGVICSDVVSLHRNLKHTVYMLDNNNQNDIIKQLSDNSTLQNMKNRYDKISAPSGKKQEYECLGKIIKDEEEIQSLLRDICKDPLSGDVDKKLNELSVLAKRIDSLCGQIPLFKEREPLTGVEALAKKIVDTEQQKKANFIKEVDMIFYKFSEINKANVSAKTILERANAASFKNSENLKAVLNEKDLLVRQRGKLRLISVPSDAKRIVALLDSGYTNRIECCEKVAELFKGKNVRLCRDAKVAYEASQADFSQGWDEYEEYWEDERQRKDIAIISQSRR